MKPPCNVPKADREVYSDINLRDCLVYLDDMVIYSGTFQENLSHLEAVFERLQEQNLKLKASKVFLSPNALP